MRRAKRLLLAYAYSSSNFFLRRNKNNNSNDRRFALQSIFSFSLSLSFALFFCSASFLLFSIRCQSLGRCHSFLFLSLSLARSLDIRRTRIRIFDQWNRCFARRPGEKGSMSMCGCRCECLDVVVTAFDKSRLFCPRRRKNCARETRVEREREEESLSGTFVVCYMIYW